MQKIEKNYLCSIDPNTILTELSIPFKTEIKTNITLTYKFNIPTYDTAIGNYAL